MPVMLDRARAEELVDALALDEVPACPACLLELAWKIRDRETLHWQTVGRTASWVWPEIEGPLEAAVIQARMREAPFAEDALADLRERGYRSPLAPAVVLRLAHALADELSS